MSAINKHVMLDMPARYVIHAATMELGGPTSAEVISRATETALRNAARLMVDAVREHRPGSLERVVFAVHGDVAENAFRAALGT